MVFQPGVESNWKLRSHEYDTLALILHELYISVVIYFTLRGLDLGINLEHAF